MRIISKLLVCLVFSSMTLFGQVSFEKDRFQTERGSLEITFIGHGTLMMEWNNRIIHIDPVGQYADYSKLPKADLILITHEHGDHLDAKAIEQIWKPTTLIVLNPSSATKLGKGRTLQNGETLEIEGITIRAVPAYNTTQGRDRYHPKGRDNGYVLQFPGLVMYVAGDTEDVPEMKDLKGIDVAFLPMNQPYTMTPSQVAAAARVIRPKVLYPYHFGETPTQELVALLKDEPGIDLRIRRLK
ncbi:MAG: MBL fold metallo-hydrolase [Spirochaetes bacterium]|nr:MBL fold metallo-hydrolase [Spirochaetota bacterium]